MNQFQRSAILSTGLRSLYKGTSNGGSVISRSRTPSSNIKWFSRNSSIDFTKNTQNLLAKTSFGTLAQHDIHDAILTIPKKHHQVRKKPTEHQEKIANDGYFNVKAFATAEEYDLEKLLVALEAQDQYEVKKFFNADGHNDVVYATTKKQVGSEPSGMYFFRDGRVVMWNCTDMEPKILLSFLKSFEEDSYDEKIVQNESEFMSFNYSCTPSIKNNIFYITKDNKANIREKFTFSNVLSLSVKLGIWEASLEKYVDSISYVTDDLKQGKEFKIRRPEMLRKSQELMSIRHSINLSSDVLECPNFHGYQDQLEDLYFQTVKYFNTFKRKRVINKKLDYCVQLADLITSHLNDVHMVRLEKIVILLVFISVTFSILN